MLQATVAVTARFTLALCLALGTMLPLFLGGPRSALAQTGGFTSQEYSFSDLGQGGRTVRGLWGATDYFLPIPLGTTPVEGSELTLVYSHSGLVQPEWATMTVLVNGEPRADVELGPENARRGTLTVRLPNADESPDGRDYAAEGYYVQIQFYLRVTDQLCEADNLPSQWAVIHPESQYTLITRPRSRMPGLESVGPLLTPRMDRQLIPRLIVPDSVLEQVDLLPAAGMAAYAVGRFAAGVGADAVLTPTIGFGTASLLAADPATPSIVLATQDDLPVGSVWGDLRWTDAGWTDRRGADVGGATSTQATDEEGDIPDSELPDNESGDELESAMPGSFLALDMTRGPQLLVTGVDAGGVYSAAYALVDPMLRGLPAGPYTALTDAVAARGPLVPHWRVGPVAFAELGTVDERRVVGRGRHTVDYFFERPPGWELEPGSALTLQVAAAPGLLPNTSWVEAAVNGITLGSYSLPQQPPSQQSSPAHLRFELPVEQLNRDWGGRPVRQLALQVRFHLDVPHSECDELAQDGLWAAVLPGSSWELSAQPATEPDLGRFPWPFVLARDTVDDTEDTDELLGPSEAEDAVTEDATTENATTENAEAEDAATPETESEDTESEDTDTESTETESEDTEADDEATDEAAQDETGATSPGLGNWVVLPAEPTEAELRAGLQVMAGLGRWAGAETRERPTLTTADTLAHVDLRAGSLILVGSPGRNELTAQALEDGLASIPSLAMPPVHALELDATGLLHLAQSPWNPDSMILIVADYGDWLDGDDAGAAEPGAGLMTAARALAVAEYTTQLRGETALIVPDLPVQVVQDSRTRQPQQLPQDATDADNEAGAAPTGGTDVPPTSAEAAPEAALESPPAIESPLAGQAPPGANGPVAVVDYPEMGRLGALAPWQVVGAVLLGIFIATVSILFYARVRRKSPAA